MKKKLLNTKNKNRVVLKKETDMARPTNRDVKLRELLALEEAISYIITSRKILGYDQPAIKGLIKKVKQDYAEGADVEDIVRKEKFTAMLVANRRGLEYSAVETQTMLDKAWEEINGVPIQSGVKVNVPDAVKDLVNSNG